jgi:hypothetical protein
MGALLGLLFGLLLGVLIGSLLAARAAERRARAAWHAAALHQLCDAPAADVKRLLGGALPPWVRDAEWQKARAVSVGHSGGGPRTRAARNPAATPHTSFSVSAVPRYPPRRCFAQASHAFLDTPRGLRTFPLALTRCALTRRARRRRG